MEAYSFKPENQNEEFVERTSVSEFVNDGAAIQTIYLLVAEIFGQMPKSESDVLMLKYMNRAYKICWYVVEKKVSFQHFRDILGRYGNDQFAPVLAWCILSIYKDWYKVDPSIINMLHSCLINVPFRNVFINLTKTAKSPERPILFSKATGGDDGVTAKDDFDVAVGLLKGAYKDMKDSNRKLQKEIENKDKTIDDLQQKVDMLKAQLKEKEQGAYKAFSLESIKKYVMKHRKADDVDVILKMLNRLYNQYRVNDDEVYKEIEEMEAYLEDLQNPAPRQITNNVKGDYIENQTNNGPSPQPSHSMGREKLPQGHIVFER